MKKRLITSLLLSIGLFACHQASAEYPSAPWVDAGITNLENQDIVDANSNFEVAVSTSSADPEANFFLAATRVLVLEQSTPGSNFLTGLGFAASGRDYYDWTSLPATNSDGKPEFPHGYNSGTAIAFYTNTLMPVISASLTNLANITDTNFELNLPGTVTGGGAYAFQDVTVDYGDVQVLRAMLTAAQFFGYSLSANNADADMSWIETNIQAKTLTVGSLLNQFPSLASKQNTAALAPSEQAAINAIQIYFGAAAFILDDRTDTNALFNLTTNDIPDEIKFQTELTNILAALTTPTELISNNIDSTLYLEPYFAGNVSLRSLFPKFNGDAYVPGSLPDYTFGGILPDLPPYETESLLLRKFPDYAGIYIGDNGLYDNGGLAPYGSFAVYVSTNGQLTVVGYDPGDQQNYDMNNGMYFSTDGSGFGVFVQATLGNGGNWQTSNSVFNANGNIDNEGDFYGTINYNSNSFYGGPLTVYLNGNLASPLGPYQTAAGYYTGTYSGSSSGSLDAIVPSDGEIFFTLANTTDGGSSQFYFSGPVNGNDSMNSFETVTFGGTEVYGLINTNSFTAQGLNPGQITGGYQSLIDSGSGTFNLSRSSDISIATPPVITNDLPIGLAVALGSTTTFQLGVSGTPPLSYQWYFNGNPIPGAKAGTLVVSNNLWTADGTYEIDATVDNSVGGATSEVCTVTVETTVPPISSNAGIYVGETATNFYAVSDSDGYFNGAFAAYVTTNGQVTVAGQDDGDGSDDGTSFGFLFHGTEDAGGYFEYSDSYLTASGDVSNGVLSAQIYYPQANGGLGEYVYLQGNLETPSGPFQTTDGLYTGIYTGASAGELYVILDASGDIALEPINASANGAYGDTGTGVFGQFYNSTQFSLLSVGGTLVSGTLNANSLIINGTYVNSDNSAGIFTVSRGTEIPPVITSNLPPVSTALLGYETTFQVQALGSEPLSYQWYLNGNPISGATNNTLLAANNVWTATGNYELTVTVSNAAGKTTSQVCIVTVTTQIAMNAGIYEGSSSDSSGHSGNFAVYAGTNGQLTVVGYDNGDYLFFTNGLPTPYTVDGTEFGILVQATVGGSGTWQESNSVFQASGSIGSQTFSGQIYYPSNSLTVTLNSASLVPALGPFQGFAGYYTGTYTGSGSPSGSLYSIVDAAGNVYFTPGNPAPGNGEEGGSSAFYNFDNDFTANDADGTYVYGILNTNSSSVNGTNYYNYYDNLGNYTNYIYSVDSISAGHIEGIYSNVLFGTRGTFNVSRSSDVTPQVPPAITNNLPMSLAVTLGSTTTFQLGVAGSTPLTYQWYFNGNPIPGATAGALVVSNDLWTTTGTNDIYATVDNDAGGATSEVCTVTVQTSVPPIATYAGIYVGNNADVTNGVSDSEGYSSGAFLVYVSTNGQVTVAGQDYGDGTGSGNNNFAFLFQANLYNGGYFTYYNGYYTANGNVDSFGDFNATLYYPQANFGSGETVTLYGNLETPYGPFQNSDGLYTGTYSGAQSGNVDVIVDASGDISLVPLSSSPNGAYGNAGTGVFGQFSNSTQFSLLSVSGTVVAGTLSGLTINGAYTNSDNSTTSPDRGTFIVNRSTTVFPPIPPTITMNLPASVTIPLGNTVALNLGVTGSTPLSYQWYFVSGVNTTNLVPGATTNTLVVSNNLWTTIGSYQIYATVANGGGTTNSQPCTVNVVTETNIPTIAITAPTPGELFSNAYFYVSGTASDKLAVTGVVVSVSNPNGTTIYGGLPTNGPTLNNWFDPVVLNSGSNTISAYAINEGGISSKTATVLMDYIVSGTMTVLTNGPGTISPNYDNTPLEIGKNYSMTATGASHFMLTNWSSGLVGGPLTKYTNNATVIFAMQSNLVLRANFEDTLPPYLKITNASPVMFWSNDTFTVMGVATDDQEVASVDYSFANGSIASSSYTNIAAANGIQWSSALLSLAAGTNVFSVYAQATNGNNSATQTVDIVYLATNILTVQTSGKGTISPDYSNAMLYVGRNYSMTASGASGFKFIDWTAQTNPGLLPGPTFGLFGTNATATFLMQTGLVMQANFKDLNPPYLRITNMLTQLITSNATFTALGVATDDEQMASVTYSFNGSAQSAVVLGSPELWTNWSQLLRLEGGTNVFSVYAAATNGNMATDTVEIVSISTNPLTLQISGKGTISPNYSNALLDAGINYNMTASPASGFKFINWTGTTNGTFVLYGTNPGVTFMMQTGLVMQANFKDLNPPYLRITNMLTQLITSNATFTALGVATDDEQMASVNFSFNGSPASEVLNGSAELWTNWSQLLALEAGTNVFSVYAAATNGNMATDTVKIVSISTNPLTLQISGKGTISPNYSNALLDAGINYNMTASPASGFKFINWTGETNGPFVLYGTNPGVTFMMQTGLVMQANFKDLNPPYLRITNLPTLSFTSNTTFEPFGVATDDEQMSFVTYSLNGSATNAVFSFNGWSNWNSSFVIQLPLQAGTNVFSAYATATNGNMATNTVTVVRISTNQLTVQISGGKGTISPNYSNAWLNAGENYSMSVSPASGFKLVNWTGETNGNFVVYGTNSSVTFMMQTGLVMQANLEDTLKPYLKITNPEPSLVLVTNLASYSVMGVATDDEEVASVNYTLNGAASTLAVSSNIYAWTASLPLSEGTNTFSAWAVATNGNLSTTNLLTIIRQPKITTFLIATNPNIEHPQAQLAFDGTNYLVVYQQGPSNNPTAMGQFVSQAGTLIGGSLPLNPGGQDDPPYLDFDGTNYLVAWADFSGATNGSSVKGVFVNPATQQPVGGVMQLSQSTSVATFGTITYGGGSYLLLWTDDRTLPESVYGALVSPSGTNSGDFLISSNSFESEGGGPAAAFDGTNFLAVWASDTGNMSINGQWISPTGLVGGSFMIYTNPTVPSGIAQLPCVDYNGTNFLVLFNTGITSNSASASNFHIQGRLVTNVGQLLVGGQQTILTSVLGQISLTTDAGPQVGVGADFDSANFLASWNQGWNPGSLATSGAINGRFLNAQGSPTTAEFPIFTARPSGFTWTWAPVYYGGTNFVLVGGVGKMVAPQPNIIFTNGAIYGAFVSP